MRRLFVALLFSLTACSPPEPASNVATDPAGLLPSDDRLANLYKQSCRVCHSVEGTGAPLIGDRSQWDARWSKGLPTLLQSTITGLNGMPPGGQCFACTAADYEALIKFLAGRT